MIGKYRNIYVPITFMAETELPSLANFFNATFTLSSSFLMSTVVETQQQVDLRTENFIKLRSCGTYY